MRVVYVLLVLVGGFGHKSAWAQRTCVDPTPTQPNWWHWQRHTHPDSSHMHFAPAAPQVDLPLGGRELAGRYTLFMTRTLGAEATSRGRLELRPHLRSNDGSTSVLWGYVEADSAILGGQPVNVASRDPDAPGVELYYKARRLDLWAGNPGFHWTDSGVGFHVFSVSDSLLIGRWVSGAAITIVKDGQHLGPPQGYFCAWREPS